MAIAFVQWIGLDAGPTNSSSLSFTSNVQAGSTLIVAVRFGNSGATLTVSDNLNAGNYHADITGNMTTDLDTVGIFSMANTAGGPCTITVQASGIPEPLRYAIHEYSGLAISNVLDKTAGTYNSAGSTSPNSGNTATTSQASELIFGFCATGPGAPTFTAGGGFTLRSDGTGAANHPAKVGTEDQIVSSTGTYASTFTLSASNEWFAMVATYKAAVVGSVGSIPQPGSPALSSPRNPLQFGKVVGYGVAVAIPAPISGIWASTSVVYGPVTPFALNVGFIPQPGPQLSSPFNNNQFPFQNSTGQPSGTTVSIQGTFYGGSAIYGGSGPVAGQLGGLLPSSSAFLGNLSGIQAGVSSGLFDGTSVFSATLTGSASIHGEWDSQSLLSMQGIGGSFQPLIPMTAVVDVRLGIGYQPWTIRNNGNIG